MLTIKDVAVVLSLGKSTVAELVRQGAITSVKLGASRRVRRTDLDHYITSLPVAS